MSGRLRTFLACVGTVVILAPLGWLWWSSLLPDEYSVMDMGYVDLGGGPAPPRAGSHARMGEGAMSIASLTVDPARRADVRVDLVARKETITLASGEEVEGYTLNGRSPGPTITARQGDLVEVRVDNENVVEGIAVHWHGIDVPNAMDGVAGVTQDAVLPGGRYTYRFVADRVGTYWYHSHQMSHEQVRGGLLGAVVVHPRGAAADEPAVVDQTVLVHQYGAHRTINGSTEDLRVDAAAGDTVRLRVVNTDNGPIPVWVTGASYRVVAVDGTDVHGPTPVEDLAVLVTAGARVDLEVAVPPSGVRVQMGGRSVLLGAGAGVAATGAPGEFVDLLSYGEPADVGFDPDDATRRFEYVIGRRPGFLDGRPGVWWTINGRRFPDVPMYTVVQGDVVVMRVENRSGEVHPMHLHGHHAVVLSHNGVAATGSPWWVDSLNVPDGDEFEIAFLADNPGVWMDHCHNLPHAAEGLVAHLTYAGFATPFEIGGRHRNEPE